MWSRHSCADCGGATAFCVHPTQNLLLRIGVLPIRPSFAGTGMSSSRVTGVVEPYRGFFEGNLCCEDSLTEQGLAQVVRATAPVHSPAESNQSNARSARVLVPLPNNSEISSTQ